jgi:serine protease Do
VAGESYVLGGDVIVKVDGVDVRTFRQLRQAIAKHKPGDELELQIYRGNDKKTVKVRLGQRDAPSR